jgi:hypothetical protein
MAPQRTNSVGQKAQSRTHSQLSPVEEEHGSKRQKTEIQQLTDLFKKEMANLNNKIDTYIDKADERIGKLEDIVVCMKTELNDQKKMVEDLSDRVTVLEKENKALIIHKNATEQKNLDNQIAVVDLSLKLTKEQFIEDMKEWAGDLLRDSVIKWVNFRKYKNISSTAYLHFWHCSDKEKFMMFVRAKQFDNNNKYTPITNDDIFNLDVSDTAKPNAINFRVPLTQTTRAIMNEARKMVKNKVIDKCMLQNGFIFVKLVNQQKKVLIESLEHLTSLNQSALDEERNSTS